MRRIALAAAVSLVVVGQSVAGMAATTLRFAHANNTGEIATDLFAEFAQRVGERSNGEITIQVFPGEQLGKEVELVQQAKAGAIDITAPSMPAASTLVPSLEMPSAPFLWRDWNEAQAVILSDAMQPAFDELAEQHDIVPLTKIWYWGWRNFTLLETEVREPADMKDLKLRVPESPVWVEMVRAFGGAPTPIPFSEVYSALQQKVVDGQENPIPTIYSRKFYEVQGVLSMTRHMLQNNMIVMNKTSFEALSPELQRILLEEAQKASALNTFIQQGREKAMLEEIRASGRVTVVDEPDRAAFGAMMKDAYPKMAERWGQENFKRLQDAVAALRAR